MTSYGYNLDGGSVCKIVLIIAREFSVISNNVKNKSDQVSDLFDAHYEQLCHLALRYMRDMSRAEDVVQGVFLSLWKKKRQLHLIEDKLAYLRRSTVNACLNELKRLQAKRVEEIDDTQLPHADSKAQGGLEYVDLNTMLKATIDRLPPRCRTVFVLSRYEQMSNSEIASTLSISIKTVENQMTKALKRLKEAYDSYQND